MKLIASLLFFSLLANADVYQDIFNKVDEAHLQTLMKDMTGQNPVTVKGETFSINDRYLPESKANYRKYWTDYFEKLGLTVTPLNYQTQFNLETEGHNLESILPGKSKDCIVLVVHYDSMGPHGSDNPAVDDDMTGMAMLMETARLLMPYRSQLHYTVRFAAVDYEEWGIEGSEKYAAYLQDLATKEGFKIISAIDDEQSGWKEGDNTFDYFDCDNSGSNPDSSSLGNLLADTAQKYSHIQSQHGCMGANSDHYAFWQVGVPAVVFSEHDPFANPHFDHNGGDTYDKIDQGYYFEISQVGITFAARVIGIDSN